VSFTRENAIKIVDAKLLMHNDHEDDDDRPNNNSMNFTYGSAYQEQRPVSGKNTEITLINGKMGARTLHIVSHKQLTLTTLPWKQNRFCSVYSCWLLNAEQH
jgi:hypothetical protein